MVQMPMAVTADPRHKGVAQTPILLKYWQVLMRHRWLVLGVIAAAIIVGVVVTLLQDPLYSAQTRIEVRRGQDNVTDVESVTPQNSDQDLEFYQTQYALLEARSLASRVSRQLNLAQDDTFFELFDISLDEDGAGLADRPARLSRDALAERQTKAVNTLLDHVAVSPIRGSALVDLQFTSPDPGLSARIANTWAESYIQANLDRRYSSTQGAREFLEERLAELRDRLEESERQLVTYAADSGIVTLSSEQMADGRTRANRTLTIADIEALNTELASATADRVNAQSRLRRGIDETLVNNDTLSALRTQRAEVSAQYSKMSSQFGNAYPPLQAVGAELREIDQEIAAQERRIREAARTRVEQAAQREGQLQSRIDRLKGDFIGEQRNSIQYNIYQREVDTNRQLYDGLLQRFKEIGVAGVGTNNVSIIDAAEVPEVPSSPSLPLNLLVSLIAGMALAGGLVFTLEQIDQSLQDPADVGDLDLSLLGVIPEVERAEVLAELKDRKSMLGEAYLAAQTNLSFLTDQGLPRSIMLTSTRPGEGKSTSALALAVMLSRVGKRVVLVDADIRSPSIGGFLALDNEQGLSNFLSGHDDLASLIRASSERGLDVITTGPPPPNAAELLSSQRFAELVTKLEGMYDAVVIDAPPVLGLADVPLISRTVDGVIYTIEANGVKMRGIEAALDRLRIAQANIFGALVTKYHARESSGYGYGYGYAYGYGYGEGRKEGKG